MSYSLGHSLGYSCEFGAPLEFGVLLRSIGRIILFQLNPAAGLAADLVVDPAAHLAYYVAATL